MTTVRIGKTDGTRAAQAAWLEAEFTNRAAFALIRIDRLDALCAELPEGDLFDAAYAIWDDYIDGRRADERFDTLQGKDITEQASIFARLVPYLSALEIQALAEAAWGSMRFETYLANPLGSIFGKLGWYAGRLTIRRIPALVGATFHGIGYDIEFRKHRRGKVVSYVNLHTTRMRLALHPSFVVTDLI